MVMMPHYEYDREVEETRAKKQEELNREIRKGIAKQAMQEVEQALKGEDVIMQHRDKEVQAAIVRLADALCLWERAAGIESILIIREDGGFVFRAASGKPDIPDDIPDTLLLERYMPSPLKGDKGEELSDLKAQLEFRKNQRERWKSLGVSRGLF